MSTFVCECVCVCVRACVCLVTIRAAERHLCALISALTIFFLTSGLVKEGVWFVKRLCVFRLSVYGCFAGFA